MEIRHEEFFFPSREIGQKIYAQMIYPAEGIKGIIQFAHGMSDYGGRYLPLFEFLAANGFAVGYNDHLGHGNTATTSRDLGYFAKEDGYKKVIADFGSFYEILDDKFPGVPHFVMGHSMGSFIVRCFLATGKCDGALIMGTCKKNSLAGMGIILANIIAKCKGERYRSKLLSKVAFGSYNKRITDSNHEWAWLSQVSAAQQDILDDEKRNKTFTASAFKDLFYMTKYANEDETMARTPNDLPIVFVSGAEDPLGPYAAGIEKLGEIFKDNGFTNVAVQIFPHARHELCHEEEEIRTAVFAFIVDWFNSQIKN